MSVTQQPTSTPHRSALGEKGNALVFLSNFAYSYDIVGQDLVSIEPSVGH